MAKQPGGGSGNGGQKDNRPVYARKYWTGSGTVEVAVFENRDDSGRVDYSTSLRKTYKVETGEGAEYPESKSFFQQELPLVAAALTDAFHAIQSLRDKAGKHQSS